MTIDTTIFLIILLVVIVKNLFVNIQKIVLCHRERQAAGILTLVVQRQAECRSHALGVVKQVTHLHIGTAYQPQPSSAGCYVCQHDCVLARRLVQPMGMVSDKLREALLGVLHVVKVHHHQSVQPAGMLLAPAVQWQLLTLPVRALVGHHLRHEDKGRQLPLPAVILLLVAFLDSLAAGMDNVLHRLTAHDIVESLLCARFCCACKISLNTKHLS